MQSQQVNFSVALGPHSVSCDCEALGESTSNRPKASRFQRISPPRRRPTSMPPRFYQLLLLLLLLLLVVELAFVTVAASSEDEEYAACAAANRTDAARLRADRLTVILTGYSERRLPLLRAIAGAYAAHPLVLAVVVLWCNPSTPDRLLLRGGGTGFPPRVAVRRAASASLNSRFLPRPSDVRTAAVAVADDDVLPDAAALYLAFATWRQHQDERRPAAGPLVGFFPRSHHLDLARGRWAYTAAQLGRYSMVLTKLMLLGSDLLRAYSCSPELAAARAVVDRERNCEDILMNFVAAEASGAGPVLVEAGGVRDWGDPRNDAGSGSGAGEGPRDGVRDVGLSATGGMSHWEKRGRCITEFHRLLGRMPLRYSYGKVVQATAVDQGLCSKGGHLVRCDQG